MNREEYDVMYRVEDRHWWYRGLRAFISARWAAYGPPPGARILDLGCGTGANLDLARTWGDTVGLDIEGLALDYTKSRGHGRLVRGNALHLPFRTESFDAILAMDVLYHNAIDDPTSALREMSGSLRPGGRIFINLPAYHWLYSSHDVNVHTRKRFSKGEIMEHARAAGLRVVWAGYWNTVLFAPIALVRLWRKLTKPKTSDLEAEPNPVAERVFGAGLALERAVTKVAPLSFGLSVFAILERP